MAAARMSITLAMMATRHAMCEQTLTQQEDNLFANLWLPDIIKSIKAGKPKYFLAPTWSEVNEAEAQEQGKLTARRRLYYSGLMMWTVFATVAAGTAILATNHFVRQRCPASDRHYLQLPGQQSTENVGERARTLQKLRVITLFLIHVVLLTVYMLQASRTGELTPKLGLSWERWLLLLAASCAWTIAQALWAVLTCQATAPRFSAGTFLTALVVYNFPVVSDGFDTCKDVAFIATLLSMDATWANALGCLCWAWLVGLYTFMIWTDNEVEDAVVLSFASVTAALNKQVAEQALADEAAPEEPEASTSSSWFNIKAKVQAAQEKALTLAFFQTTRQKRRLLLLEDGFQGVCAGLTILGTGGGVGAFFFIAMMNIALPGCKWLFAWAFHPSIAATLRDWIFKEAEVARNAGLTARFENLRVKLIEIMEGDQESEEWFPAGTEVNDQHARLVAWSLQDSEKRAWIIKDGACHVTKTGWETLTVATASQDGGLQKLVLNGVKDLTFDALAAAVKTKDSSLRELSVQNADIGAAGAEALANIVANQECPLRELDLQGNGIGDAGAQALADVISKQECGLTHLDLEYNSIGDQGAAALANAIGFQDRFHSLRAMLIDISELKVDSEELCFPGSAVNVNDGHAYLAAWAFKDCAARKLVIKDGSCQITQRGWEALTVIMDASSQDSRLQKLVLDGVSDLNMEYLAAVILKQDCSLQELDLKNTGIGDAGAKVLANAVAKQECTLTVLDLEQTDIRAEGAGALAEAIGLQECLLHELKLDDDAINAIGAPAFAKAMAKKDCFHSLRAKLLAITGLHMVDELSGKGTLELPSYPSVSEDPVTDVHAQLVAYRLKDCAPGQRKWKIYIRPVHVTKEGWDAVMMDTDSGLIELRLSRIKNLRLGDLLETVKAKECSLKKLDLMHCIIGDSGARACARAIRNQDCGLTELNLGLTGIGDDGAKHLAVAISDKDCSLRKLSLSQCNIGDEGARAFVQNLAKEECRHLEELRLTDNRDISKALQRDLRAIDKKGLKVLVDPIVW